MVSRFTVLLKNTTINTSLTLILTCYNKPLKNIKIPGNIQILKTNNRNNFYLILDEKIE